MPVFSCRRLAHIVSARYARVPPIGISLLGRVPHNPSSRPSDNHTLVGAAKRRIQPVLSGPDSLLSVVTVLKLRRSVTESITKLVRQRQHSQVYISPTIRHRGRMLTTIAQSTRSSVPISLRDNSILKFVR